MNAIEKIISWDALPAWRAGVRQAGRRLVVTNGCFDILHAGHVTYLEQARARGDALLVGLNGDASVRALKGEGRPINIEGDRALVLAALAAVDAVAIFQEVRAVRFLELARPDIYVKGGDYTLETINQEERHAVESGGGTIVFQGFLAGRSTTKTLERMARA